MIEIKDYYKREAKDLTNFLFDTPKIKIWWCKYIKRESSPPQWLLIEIDQIFHFISLIPITFLYV